jgi:polyphenol oxidase
MKIIFPKIFEGIEQVEAVFTEANRDRVNLRGVIAGLNLGFNTQAERQEVESNFTELFSYLNCDPERIAIAEQVHGNHIELVTKPGVLADTDGLITTVPGLAIGIRVADCAAILAADPVNRVAGAFHAGWKGAAGDIVLKGIRRMIDLGAEPQFIRVFTSPCISQKNFEVGTEVAELFPAQFVDRESYNKPHVNLSGFIHHQLIETGLNPEYLQISDQCTIDNEKYYSYRREREKAGRMLAMIKLIQ